MIDGKRILAVIPARSGSKGLPGKNVRPLNGLPLLGWPVRAALGSTLLDEVVVSTDCEEYAQIARGLGARVPFLRPEGIANDSASSVDVVLHAVNSLAARGLNFHYVILLEPTSPLTDAGDIDAALTELHTASAHADAIVGVAAMETSHPAFAVKRDEGGIISPFIGNEFRKLPRRQELEPVFCLDGSLYASSISALERERSFYHARTLGYRTARHKVFEVDDIVDFVCIEAVMRHFGEAEAYRVSDDKRSEKVK